ncbi:hypothetical protein K504DRAFT_205613 [Pleomassaria siparia CBS 279.74]|uniref:Uncharacterized protein n=1 Tax=Pleomassaria siparia CBS 279.74 TaxID=1314801 RepID=A0A6G1KI36_9PLEO|nr:hypothetical protein K504DRAFT_205613 [Pleomassaria siparia CBS 279.74]
MRMRVATLSFFLFQEVAKKNAKTYNSRDSPMVTHLTTNPPVQCLNIAEQTGCVSFIVLWSYVKETSKPAVHRHDAVRAGWQKQRGKKTKKHTTAGIRQWSPT